MRVSLNLSFATILLITITTTTNAFTPQQTNARSSTTTLAATDSNGGGADRRAFLRNIAGVAFGAAAVVSNGDVASASYSAYANREKDWEDRKATGDVAYSTARDLKRALKEVAPMNTEKSKMFCPNGTSSNVSPLMENKCSDELMATPSVFGRTQDIVGNSIPGFADGKRPSSITGTASLTAEAGGFPKYK